MARNLTGGKSPSRKPLTFEVRRDDIISSLEVTYDTNFTQDNVPVWDDTNQAFVPSLYYFSDDVITLEDGIGNDLYSIDSNHIGALQEANDPNTENPFQTLEDIQAIDHADLLNLNSASYTHLTAAQATDLTDGGLTNLHQHSGVASGYLVYRNTGDYIKIASVEFTTFGRCCFSIDFVGGVYDLSNAGGKLYVSISSFPFGDPPFVSIRLENHSINIRPDDITADTRPGNSTVDIWLRIESSRASRINYFTNVGQGDSYQIPPTFYSGAATTASLPEDGTLTACISSDSIGAGQPTSAPILNSAWYRDTNTSELYHWDGTAWYHIPRGQPVGTDGRDE